MGRKTEAHKNELIAMLKTVDFISVNSVSEKLGISLPTARRLCVQLGLENKAVRVHGGLRPLEPDRGEYSFDRFKNECSEEKRRIARYASSLVQSDQVIFIEAGTTLSQFALALAERIRNREITNVVIFTNSLINLNLLHPVHSNIQLIGGQYRAERKDFVGYLSELMLRNLHFDLCFIGADAISLSSGVMAMDMDTVRFDAELAAQSKQVVILAHAAKFYRNSLISYVPLNKVSAIITDDSIQPSTLSEYRQKGIHIEAV